MQPPRSAPSSGTGSQNCTRALKIGLVSAFRNASNVTSRSAYAPPPGNANGTITKFYANPKYRDMLMAFYKSKTWEQWQKDIIEKIVK